MSQASQIMVVEDNDFVRMQLVRYLEDSGHEVVEAVNGLKAQELLSAKTALVVLDIRMAPIDGFEFIKAVRGKYTHLPIIVVTGDQNPDLLNEASKWNVSAVLMKPVEKDRLIKMVGRALQQGQKDVR